MEHLYKGQAGDGSFVPCRELEVVFFSKITTVEKWKFILILSLFRGCPSSISGSTVL